MLNILVIDDEVNIRKTLTLFCETQGHTCISCGNIQDAISLIEDRAFDVAFIDVRLGIENGIDFIPKIISICPWLKVVVITAYGSVESAVNSMKLGATDFLTKPFIAEQLTGILTRISEIRRLELSVQSIQDDLGKVQPEMMFHSQSPKMQKVIELARQIATSDAIVLLEGPSGSGKTVLAKRIHQWSGRASMPFGMISCPSLNKDLFESELFGHVKGSFTGAVRNNPGKISYCERGTLFLDEISDLPLSMQPKLLRFIQDREFERVGDQIPRRADVRLISATNQDLYTIMQNGAFREDLYYRLSVINIRIPALHERKEDIIPLAKSYLAFFGQQNNRSFQGFDEEVIKIFLEYDWPGNLRELRNTAERLAILCPLKNIGKEWLPSNMVESDSAVHIGDRISLDKLEKHHIKRILLQAKTLQEAASILGIDQATLWRKRKQYDL